MEFTPIRTAASDIITISRVSRGRGNFGEVVVNIAASKQDRRTQLREVIVQIASQLDRTAGNPRIAGDNVVIEINLSDVEESKRQGAVSYFAGDVMSAMEQYFGQDDPADRELVSAAGTVPTKRNKRYVNTSWSRGRRRR